ncbi:MAG: hypothetical protein JWR08_2213 [Enterovirga sp.]|nr:hypothetical protein [Enterovirga sp.]
MPLYFAYGSNMDRAQMALRCPASTARGPARLARHRLVIMREGYASVVRDPRREVHGILWDLALADMPSLDRYEGVAGGLYVKAQLPVLAEAGPRRALVYLGRDAGPGLPRPGYLDAVLAAARAAGLPPSYLREIEALAPRGARSGTGRGASAPGGECQAGPSRGGPVPGVSARRTSPREPEPDRHRGSWHP